MARAPGKPKATREDAPGEDRADREHRPELLIKLQKRKERHARRSLPARIAVVVLGVVLVLLGVAMSGPGIPGPGIVVILLGLSFLALEFKKAEWLLERAIVWADRAKQRTENASRRQKAVSAVLTMLAIGGFVAAAIAWDIPLLPV